MLNKKNIAMAMAAVTVATPVATAFAAPVQRAVVDSTNEAEIKAIKEKAYAAFQKKYTENKALLADGNKAERPAYTIGLAVAAKEEKNVTTVAQSNYSNFVKALDKAVAELEENQKVVVSYQLNGRELEDGQIVDWKESKYVKDTSNNALDMTSYQGGASAAQIGQYKNDELVDGTPVAKIKISDDTETKEARYITVKIGDVKLDTKRPILRQVNGYYVDANGNALKKVDVKTVETLDESNGKLSVPGAVVDGFYPLVFDAVGSTDTDTTEVTPSIEYNAIVKDASAIENVDMVVSDIYEVETGRNTVKGNELVKVIRDQRDHDDDKEDVEITATDKDNNKFKYFSNSSAGNDKGFYKLVTGDETVQTGLTKLSTEELTNVKFTFKKTDKLGAQADWKTVGTVTVKGERKAPLSHVVDMVEGELGVYTAAGTNRYKTAVEVSKMFNTAANVVLVSGDEKSLVDGLTATPLAKKLSAPVLLTKKDEIPQEVVAQLKELQTTTVYIVGGTSAVSEEVVKELETKHGITVKRLAGTNRYETSLEVAKEIAGTRKVDEAFVVGGYGEADALSAAGVAGANEAPILLTPQDGITKDVELFLKTKVNSANATDIFVVGGNGVVSDAAYAQLVDTGLEVKRLAGERRQDTNAAVIEEFYGSKAVTNLVVAKSDNKGLVDALGAGALAAKHNAPLVLATDKLTDNQEDALNAFTSFTGKKVQVGYGISEAVAKFIKNFR